MTDRGGALGAVRMTGIAGFEVVTIERLAAMVFVLLARPLTTLTSFLTVVPRLVTSAFLAIGGAEF